MAICRSYTETFGKVHNLHNKLYTFSEIRKQFMMGHPVCGVIHFKCELQKSLKQCVIAVSNKSCLTLSGMNYGEVGLIFWMALPRSLQFLFLMENIFFYILAANSGILKMVLLIYQPCSYSLLQGNFIP